MRRCITAYKLPRYGKPAFSLSQAPTGADSLSITPTACLPRDTSHPTDFPSCQSFIQSSTQSFTQSSIQSSIISFRCQYIIKGKVIQDQTPKAMSPSSNPASAGRMRDILKKLPNEILNMIMANLLWTDTEQMDIGQDTFIQWITGENWDYENSLREAHHNLHNAALASPKFSESANHYLYRMLEITRPQALMNIWKSLSIYPDNAASIHYLLCRVVFDSPTTQSTVTMRASDLLQHTPLPRWANGVQLSSLDLQPKNHLAQRFFLDILRRCTKLKRLHLHHEAAQLIEGLPSLAGAPQMPLYALGQTLCTLVFEDEEERAGVHGPLTCGERLQGLAQLVMPNLREIEALAWDGTWQMVLQNSQNRPPLTIVQRILSLAIDHNQFYEAQPVLQPVGLKDMTCLEKFEVHTCLLTPENSGRPALPLGSHNLNHQLTEHAGALKILHIDAPIKQFEDPLPHPEGDRLLTCLSALRTLVSLNISLHLLFPTLAAFWDGLEGEPHEREVLRTFLDQCPHTLQNIHFLEDWHPTSFGLSEDEDSEKVSQDALIKLVTHMYDSWLMRNGKPQQRTLQLTPKLKSLYAERTHAEIMSTTKDLRASRVVGTWLQHTYTYRLFDEVSYTGVHEQLLPLELADWLR